VRVAGSLKFDGVASTPPPDVVRLQEALRADQRRLVVAGSTHDGEEQMLLDAFGRVAAGHTDLVLLLAPRHPERFAAVASLIERAGLPLVRYSQLATAPVPLPPRTVVLLDAVGPLAQCYALGVLAFVGGSLVPVGGHNVLEPARAARPVLVGPHTTNAAEVVERLIAGGGALRVSTAESLAWAIAGMIDEPGRAADMGRRARALLDSGQGAVERHLKIIAARLTSARFAQATEGA
jgi:3-deoxy-D-manno-octulosonic-acid transferase